MGEFKEVIYQMKQIVELVKGKVDLELNKLFMWNICSSVHDKVPGKLDSDGDGSIGILYELQCLQVKETPLLVIKIMKDESFQVVDNSEEVKQDSESKMSSRAFREDKLEKLQLVNWLSRRLNEGGFRDKMSSYTVATHDAVSYRWNKALETEYYESEIHLEKFPQFVVKMYEPKFMGQEAANSNSLFSNDTSMCPRVRPLPERFVGILRSLLIEVGGRFLSLKRLILSEKEEDCRALRESVELKYRCTADQSAGVTFIRVSLLEDKPAPVSQALKYDAEGLIEEIKKLMVDDEEALKMMIGEFKTVEKDEEITATFLMDSSYDLKAKACDLFN
jgi:hypothetical protein